MQNTPLQKITRMERRAARWGLRRGAFAYDGEIRDYLFYKPRPTQNPPPLLLALHGGAGNPLSMAKVTRFHEIAEEENFFVAYPGGAGPGFLNRTWNAGPCGKTGWAEKNEIDDAGFLSALIDALCEKHALDRDRVYVAGMSKGAMMAYRLAAEASEKIAAVAAVAGPLCEEPEATPKPVSVLHIHGAMDENVPFSGGRGRRTRPGVSWPSSERSLNYWRNVSHCDKAEEEEDAQGVVKKRYSNPETEDVEVDLLLLKRAGHVWPGAKPALWQRLFFIKGDDSVAASEEIWTFVKDKRRRSGAASNPASTAGKA